MHPPHNGIEHVAPLMPGLMARANILYIHYRHMKIQIHKINTNSTSLYTEYSTHTDKDIQIHTQIYTQIYAQINTKIFKQI